MSVDLAGGSSSASPQIRGDGRACGTGPRGKLTCTRAARFRGSALLCAANRRGETRTSLLRQAARLLAAATPARPPPGCAPAAPPPTRHRGRPVTANPAAPSPRAPARRSEVEGVGCEREGRGRGSGWRSWRREAAGREESGSGDASGGIGLGFHPGAGFVLLRADRKSVV